MNKAHFVELYGYTDWANRRVWDCVMKLSQEDFEKHLTFSIGSIYEQCTHTMGVEYWWPHYLKTDEVRFMSDEERKLYTDRALLRQRWDEISAANQAYVATLTDDDLQRTVQLPFWKDKDIAITVAQALTQVVNHSTDHRSQIMAMLHTLGGDGVEQDYLMYLHQKA